MIVWLLALIYVWILKVSTLPGLYYKRMIFTKIDKTFYFLKAFNVNKLQTALN